MAFSVADLKSMFVSGSKMKQQMFHDLIDAVYPSAESPKVSAEHDVPYFRIERTKSGAVYNYVIVGELKPAEFIDFMPETDYLFADVTDFPELAYYNNSPAFSNLNVIQNIMGSIDTLVMVLKNGGIYLRNTAYQTSIAHGGKSSDPDAPGLVTAQIVALIGDMPLEGEEF
ncbi:MULTISPECIES: hypothetical protein [Lactococcus]|uniref:hypothetical protein n=1 Tax=Lactococcus TaxID=1357 RepID=UPI000ECD954F|nr:MULTISPECIES: hypothetical protein [Lactococcus]HAP14775.1 hypothetical protein [Lactococcus sp.]